MMPIPNHRQGDLFQNSTEDLERGLRIACVGENGGPYDTGQLARGYFAAAHQLLLWDVPFDQIEKMPLEAKTALQVSIDLKVYPILYCYRHGIELALKHLLFQLPRFFNQPLTLDELNGHSLEKWWNELVPYLDRLRTEAAKLYADDAESCRILEEQLRPDILANIGSIICEVHGLDESSTTFRYALDRSGNIPLGDQPHIVLDKVYRFILPINVWFMDMIYRSDVLAGPPPGLEPNWLYWLEPLCSPPVDQDGNRS